MLYRYINGGPKSLLHAQGDSVAAKLWHDRGPSKTRRWIDECDALSDGIADALSKLDPVRPRDA